MKRNLLIKQRSNFESTFRKSMFLTLLATCFLGSYTSNASDNITIIAVIQETVDGGTLSEDPFFFCVGDGEPDHVSLVSVEGAQGPNAQWVVTDEAGNILGLPPTPEAVNFDEAGPGVCLIWHLRYADGLEGLEAGNNVADLMGVYDLSDDNVRVYRSQPEGGELSGGPFAFTVGDGTADNVSGVAVSGNSGANSQWVVTDEAGTILGLPPSPEAVNFDEAGPGVCLIWHLSYADGLEGLEGGNNVADLYGCYDFSNEVRVVRTEAVVVDGGTLSEDPFFFCVGDGEPDHVSLVSVEGAQGPNAQWVVTDEAGNILGLPPTPEAVNFDEAGPGVCLIWHLRYADGLEGLEAGNNVADLMGVYDLSDDNVRVYRSQPEGGELSGGPFAFTVGDGTADNVSGVAVSGNSGANSQWVVTDEAGTILGLPPSPEAVNFDEAGPGVCLIWHLSYADGLEGLEGGNNVADLYGCYDFSNEVRVVRTEAVVVDGGTLSEDPFFFCVGDGEPDHVSLVSVEGAQGPNAQWVVTDEAGNILGLPPTPEAVNFDEAGPGVCLIWHLRYADGLEGLEAGNNVADLMGVYDLSDDNVRVYRSQPEGGELSGGPFAFTVGDGTADNVSGVAVSGNSGANSQWVVTDEAGTILGLPPSPEAVNFDEAGPGVCLIWHLSYADGLEGLEGGNNVADLYGCYDFSNEVRVVRTEAVVVDGGTLSEDPFFFCVGDGEPDHVSLVSVEGAQGPNAQWVVTDEAGNILGLPPTPEAVNFDEAGPGVCLIWHLRYADGLEGLEAGNNVADLMGVYDLSDDNVRVYRSQPEGGELSGGPFAFTVGDGTADNVSGVAVSGNSGANSQWVVTDEAGTILGLPPSPEAVNFDEAGPGVCLIWHLSYADGLEGLEGGNNVADLYGCYDFSNEVRVERISESTGKSAFTVYPLPAIDVLNIDMDIPAGKKVGIKLFDLAGNDITANTERINQNTVDVQNVPSGMYFLSISVGNGRRVTKKVIIQ